MRKWSARYIVYTERNLIVQKGRDCYTIMNTALPFKTGHCHIKSLTGAKNVTHHASNKLVPLGSGNYFLLCLQRVTSDKEYSDKLQLQKIKGLKYFEQWVR